MSVRVSGRTAIRLSLAILVSTLACVGVGLVLFVLNRRAGFSTDIFSYPNLVQGLVPSVAFLVVGALLASRRPSNPIGWLCLGFGSFECVDWAAMQYAGYVLVTHPGASAAAGLWLAALSNGAFAPPVAALIFIVLLFPTGRLISPRWRPVAWVAVISFAGAFVSGAMSSLSVPFQHHTNPIGLGGGGAAGNVAVLAVVLGELASVVAAFGAVVVRYRRSRGEQRAQLKWLVFAASVLPVGLLTHALVELLAPSGISTVETIFSLCLGGFPIAIGIAILKYRLYEIDRLIRRTLTYLILTGVLVGVFVGLVVLTTRALPFSSPVAVAASTLAGAALFNPLRKRVQHLVDRRFNRARYDAEATVTALRVRLREAVDLDVVQRELLHTVERAVEPAHTSLWIRPSGMRARP